MIGLILVRFADLQRVDDRREPIDELVEVHAWCVLARGGRPVVLRQTEKVVEFGIDELCYSRRCVRLGLFKGCRGCEADCAAALGRAKVLYKYQGVG